MTAPRPRRLWSPLPDGNQRRLIELLLASRPDAEMLARWADDVDIQALDDGSARLLPALYLKLTAAGIDHPWLPIMRGWYRRTLYRNRLLVHRGLDLVDRLAARGIPCLLLKGASIASLYYRDLGARPMGDVDLLIAEGAARAEVMAILRGDGRTDGRRMRFAGRSLHADTYVDADGFEYDLHWHLLPEIAYAGSTRGLWQRAQPIALEGRVWRTLSAEDHALHGLIHGMRMSDVPPLRWIADIAAISAAPGFDWKRVVAGCSELSVGRPAGEGLCFLLAAGYADPGAAAAAAALARMPERWSDRFLFDGLLRPPGLVYSTLRPWLIYRRLARLDRRPTGPVDFVRFLARLWNLRGGREVPKAAMARVAGKLKASLLMR